MLKKRIIPCLDVKDGRTVKGVNFVNLRDAGDAVELAKIYAEQGADELVFLDITASVEKRKTLVALVEKVALAINIPFTVGGGIGSVDDVRAVLDAGADKVSINSAAVYRPELISEISAAFGRQCLVVAIDANLYEGEWRVFTHGGRKPTELKVYDWAKEVEKLGAGEILLTSMQHDGTKDGFAIELTGTVNELVNIPVIASGGAGTIRHFVDIFTQTTTSAALAASIFHFGEIPVPELKTELHQQGIAIRLL